MWRVLLETRKGIREEKMAKTYALGLITAVAASASLSKNNCAYADGPFSFSPFSTPSSNASQPSSSSKQSAPSNPPSSSSTGDAAEPPPPPPKVRNDHPRTTSAGFDPEPLERGVQALEKISQSSSAKQVLEAIKKQEETRQVELNAKAAEYNALKAQFETAENEYHRSRNQELVKLQEESSIRQEQARRATEEQIQAQRRQTEREKAEIERETIRVRAIAEAEGRAHEAKLAEDVNRRILIDRANAEREKWVSAINTTFDHIGGGLKAILTDQNKLVVAVGGVTALAAGVYTTREGAKVIWSYVDRILGQPSLIRESSKGKYPWSGLFSRSIGTLSRGGNKGHTKDGKAFGDVILHPSLQRRIEHLANATTNTKSHQAPFRNMLFYGPPGTGKTMAAREMARKSGLDYALMTGGDVAPLGPQAVTKIHELFDWAKKSRQGLLLFIDEADAFLCERNKTYMSEAQRSALNALLFRTGDQSKDIVLALATNRPGDLDSAVADRIDEVLEFPLPGEEERFKLLKLYLDKYIAQSETRKPGWFRNLFKRQPQKIEMKGLTDDMLKEAAAKTDGFSGREIAKLMASVQAAVYGSENCVLDPSLFREVVDYKVAEHQQRRKLAGGDKGSV
ncbi:AAA-type ATPase family protein [Prunus dulcis]|uniref:AAA-type ATPase family protein n=1 Tax=Prunus dulcis TaxID=3755 RepID=A0A4Y1R2Y3_PRUDU|nr:AAA-type ATPase family protein [Prunus dulcis]